MKLRSKDGKLHYRMYKSGKLWIVIGAFSSITFFSVSLESDIVRADVHNYNYLSNSLIENYNASSVDLKASEDASNASSVDLKASEDASNASSVDLKASEDASNASSVDLKASEDTSNASSVDLKVSKDASNASSVDLKASEDASNASSIVSIPNSIVSSTNEQTYDSKYDNKFPDTLNTYYNQNFHYNNPQGFSNDLQSFVPHYNSQGNIDYWDLYYLSSQHPNNSAYNNQWYHVITTDFSHFIPGKNQDDPTSIDNVAIPSPLFKNVDGTLSQISIDNKNGLPWGNVVTGSVISNDHLFSKDTWGNYIDPDAQLAYFSSFGPYGIYLAYSNDGKQFHPYSDEPVATISMIGNQKSTDNIDFRDSFVTKNSNGDLIMYVAGGLNEKMFVLSSKDGLKWNYNSNNDIDLNGSGVAEIPHVTTINGQPIMFFGSQPDTNNRIGYTKYVTGHFDNDGIFKKDSNIYTLDEGPDNYAGSFVKIDDSLLAEVGWLGDWVYSPSPWSSGIYNTMHYGSFTLGRALQYNDGNVYTLPLDPGQSILQNSEHLNSANDVAQIPTNNKIVIDFNNVNSIEKNITLKRNDNNFVKINFNNNKMTVTRSETKNVVSGINTTTSTDLENKNINSVVLYVDNDSIEIYLPDIKSMYTLMNIPNESSNQSYTLNVDKDSNVKTYTFGKAIDSSYINDMINSTENDYNGDTSVKKNINFNNQITTNINNAKDFYNKAIMIGNDARSNVYLKMANDYLSYANSLLYVEKLNPYDYTSSQSNSDSSSADSKPTSSSSTESSVATSESSSSAISSATNSNESSSAISSTSNSNESSSAVSRTSNSNTSSSTGSNASSVNSSTSTTTGTTVTPTASTTTNTTSSSSSSSSSSSAASSISSFASSVASSSSTSASSSSANSSASSAPVDKNKAKIKAAKDAMNKAQKAVKVAEKRKNKSHSKTHVKNYNKALSSYYKSEKQYLKVAKLYNHKYYYDFDKVTKHSKYVKLSKKTFVYDSKQFKKINRIHKLKKGTKVEVKKIVRNGKTTRFNIGHNKFITGLKSFIHKLTK